MTKYLNYVKLELNKIDEPEISEILITEIETYQKYWKKYAADSTCSPFYNSITGQYDRHIFHLHTGESISIRWDIDKLYKYAMSYLPITNISLSEFDSLTYSDRLTSADEFSRIYNEISTIHNHKYFPILAINFKPTREVLILDGRHRYIEYKKFKPYSSLPIYILDDEACFTSIIHKNELLGYIILHNIEVINDFLLCQGTLERIMNLKNCMG